MHDQSFKIPIFLCFLGLFLFINGLAFYMPARRRRKMQALAERNGLRFLDDVLPAVYPGFPRQSRWFEDQPKNVVFGDSDGDLVLAFDLQIGIDERGAKLTVVARRCQTPPATPWMHRRLRCETNGRWRSAYVKFGRLGGATSMPPREIEEAWRILRTSRGTDYGAPVSSEVHIYPRNSNRS